jgi:excisionase family DNA binding protein
MGNSLLTPEQVAQELQIHHFTVLKLLRTRRLKGIRIGRRYRIREKDLDKFLEQCEA